MHGHEPGPNEAQQALWLFIAVALILLAVVYGASFA